MKKFLMIVSVAVFLSSCAAYSAAPVLGALYTDVKAPAAATSNAVGKKVGSGKASSILGLVATGDASIETAAKKAGISKISHIDYHSKSILGIFATYEVFVYGE